MFKSTAFWGLIVLAGVTLVGCDPVPRRVLNAEEKQADLLWMYSKFGANYAPLAYKQSRLGFDYEQLKAETTAKALQTQTNEEFYSVVYEFVSRFQDAHASASLTSSDLPNRATVSYLGFSGERSGEHLIVRSLLPTILKESNYPINVGDLILLVDGKPLRQVVNEELLQWRNLGHDEANFTYHANKIFSRISITNGTPRSDRVVLRVRRGSEEFDVELPWIKKDLSLFKFEQNLAKERQEKKTSDVYALSREGGEIDFRFQFLGFDGRIEIPSIDYEKISSRFRKSFEDGFRFVDAFSGWKVWTEVEGSEEVTPEKRIREIRYVPEGAVFLSAKTYPAYLARVDGNLFGTIVVDTFSPDVSTTVAHFEFLKTLEEFQTLGVERVVIDLINNGGGSLLLGLRMAQALTFNRLTHPGIQFKVSDSWLDQFERSAHAAASDAHRETYRRLFVDLQMSREKGEKLSQAYPTEVLGPFTFVPNTKLKAHFKVALLVNEMCASMCDIFSAVLKDAGLATIVGTRTMGAGGNVVSYNQAPNSHFDVRQTESLILRRDGTYIENHGVEPDVSVPVAQFAASKYQEVFEAGVKAIK